MKKHKDLSTIFIISLIAGICGLAWIFIEGIVLGSSDPNIGAGGLMVVGFALAAVTGIAWIVSVIVSRSHS